MKILSPNETIKMLGTKDEFENSDRATCKECGMEFRMVHNEDEINMEIIDFVKEHGKCPDCQDETDELMEENNKLDLMESQLADCEDLE